MLKITKPSGKGHRQTIKLEGEILEPWVSAVRWACTTLGRRSKRRVLDLSSVTYVDAVGAQLLRDLKRDGVEIVDCSGFVRELLNGDDP